MSSRALITAPSAHSRVDPPLPERLRRGRLNVTGAEPAAHQRRWHRPEMPALGPTALWHGCQLGLLQMLSVSQHPGRRLHDPLLEGLSFIDP